MCLLVIYFSISVRKIYYSSPIVLRVWSPDHQIQHHLDPVRNANSWAPTQSYWIRSSAAGAQQSVSKQALQESLVSLGTTALALLVRSYRKQMFIMSKIFSAKSKIVRFSFLHSTKANFIVFLYVMFFLNLLMCSICVFCETPFNCISPHFTSMRKNFSGNVLIPTRF